MFPPTLLPEILPNGGCPRARLGRGIIYDVKYAPDGTRLAAASSSGVWFYDSATGDGVALMRSGNSFRAFDVAFSPDGRTLAAGGWSKIHLWDVVTGMHKRTLDGHQGRDTFVAFSPDGYTLASGSSDGTVLLWEIIPVIENTQVEEPLQVTADVNEDGRVDIQDLVLVAGRLGKSAENREDVNGDGIVNILDLVLVAGMIDNLAGAPLIYSHEAVMLRTTDVKQ